MVNCKRTIELKDCGAHIVLYIPKELVEDVGVLPKINNLNYISTIEEYHPKDFKVDNEINRHR